MSTLTSLLPSETTSTSDNTVEEQVNQLLIQIESAPLDVQAALLGRLMIGLASKITNPMASSIVKGAQSATAPKKKKTNPKSELAYEGSLRELSDSSDPIEAWHHFGGAETLSRVLLSQPQALLERMLRNPRMPEGKQPNARASRDTIAKNIIERLNHHFQNNS